MSLEQLPVMCTRAEFLSGVANGFAAATSSPLWWQLVAGAEEAKPVFEDVEYPSFIGCSFQRREKGNVCTGKKPIPHSTAMVFYEDGTQRLTDITIESLFDHHELNQKYPEELVKWKSKPEDEKHYDELQYYLNYDDASRLAFTFLKGENIYTVWLHNIKSLDNSEKGVNVEFRDGNKEVFDSLTPADYPTSVFFHTCRIQRQVMVYGNIGETRKRIPMNRVRRIELDVPEDGREMKDLITEACKARIRLWHGPGSEPVNLPKKVVFEDGTSVEVDDGKIIQATWWYGSQIISVGDDSWIRILTSMTYDGKYLHEENITKQYSDIKKISIKWGPEEKFWHEYIQHEKAKYEGLLTLHCKDGTQHTGSMNPLGDMTGLSSRHDKFDYATKYGRVLMPVGKIKEIIFLPRAHIQKE